LTTAYRERYGIATYDIPSSFLVLILRAARGDRVSVLYSLTSIIPGLTHTLHTTHQMPEYTPTSCRLSLHEHSELRSAPLNPRPASTLQTQSRAHLPDTSTLHRAPGQPVTKGSESRSASRSIATRCSRQFASHAGQSSRATAGTVQRSQRAPNPRGASRGREITTGGGFATGHTRRGYSQRVLYNMQTRLLFDVGGSRREDEIDVQAFMHGR